MFCKGRANGLRYLRWGGDGEAVQLEKGSGVENCLGCAQNPQRQVHALLGRRGGVVTIAYSLTPALWYLVNIKIVKEKSPFIFGYFSRKPKRTCVVINCFF